jgi:hypothetical protein
MGNKGWGVHTDLEDLKLHTLSPVLLFLQWSGFILATSKKSRTQKGDVTFHAEYPRTVGTTAPNKVLYKLPHEQYYFYFTISKDYST